MLEPAFQGSTKLDEKFFKAAMEQFEAQTKHMVVKQQELQKCKEVTETRFRDIQDKLGRLVDMASSSLQALLRTGSKELTWHNRNNWLR
jgi:hypothetical protein